jgi:tRNA(fMet)-specific endonuclease VapC
MVMRYLLDSSILIFVIKDPESIASLRLRKLDVADISISSVVEGGLYHGAKKYGNPSKRAAILDELLAPYSSLSYDSACVPHYPRIRDHLERQGRIIGGNDLMIAAIALTHDLTVVTNNCDEFGRVPGLKVEDWTR